MCLIALAWQNHPRHRLVLVANRDEFFERETDPVRFWEDCPKVLAGRDLEAGGTWCGITRDGRFAALTNYRDAIKYGATGERRSRGLLVADYLTGEARAGDFAQQAWNRREDYAGFNLLVGDREDLYYVSNRHQRMRLGAGIHGLSNGEVNGTWPKVRKAKAGLRGLISNPDFDVEAAFEMMADRNEVEDRELPETGVGVELERFLSPLFIAGQTYGTRCTSVITLDHNGDIAFFERAFNDKGVATGTVVFRHRREQAA